MITSPWKTLVPSCITFPNTFKSFESNTSPWILTLPSRSTSPKTFRLFDIVTSPSWITFPNTFKSLESNTSPWILTLPSRSTSPTTFKSFDNTESPWIIILLETISWSPKVTLPKIVMLLETSRWSPTETPPSIRKLLSNKAFPRILIFDAVSVPNIFTSFENRALLHTYNLFPKIVSPKAWRDSPTLKLLCNNVSPKTSKSLDSNTVRIATSSFTRVVVPVMITSPVTSSSLAVTFPNTFKSFDNKVLLTTTIWSATNSPLTDTLLCTCRSSSIWTLFENILFPSTRMFPRFQKSPMFWIVLQNVAVPKTMRFSLTFTSLLMTIFAFKWTLSCTFTSPTTYKLLSRVSDPWITTSPLLWNPSMKWAKLDTVILCVLIVDISATCVTVKLLISQSATRIVPFTSISFTVTFPWNMLSPRFSTVP